MIIVDREIGLRAASAVRPILSQLSPRLVRVGSTPIESSIPDENPLSKFCNSSSLSEIVSCQWILYSLIKDVEEDFVRLASFQFGGRIICTAQGVEQVRVESDPRKGVKSYEATDSTSRPSPGRMWKRELLLCSEKHLLANCIATLNCTRHLSKVDAYLMKKSKNCC